MFRALVLVVVSAFSLMPATQVRAATVTIESAAIDPTGLFSLDGFDSRLGTLDRVSLQLVGVVLDTVLAAQNLVALPGPVPVPLPTPYSAPLLRDLSLRGISGSDITTLASGLVLTSTVSANGVGGLVDAPPAAFDIGLSFTGTTDITGIVSGSGLILNRAERADFVPGALPLIFRLETRSLPADPRLTPVVRRVSGLVIATYTYTPASVPNPPPAAIPLPAGAWLLLAGLATFPLLRRRKAT